MRVRYAFVFGLALAFQSAFVYAYDYGNAETRRAGEVEYGVVTNSREVSIQGETSGVGASVGGVLGALAGSRLGGGDARYAVGLLSGAAGAMLGRGAESIYQRSQGTEVSVMSDSGSHIAVVQPKVDDFYVGQRVRIIRMPSSVRVVSN